VLGAASLFQGDAEKVDVTKGAGCAVLVEEDIAA